MKTIASIIIITLLLSSCSNSKFLTRKYTSGIWVEKIKGLGHKSKPLNDSAFEASQKNVEVVTNSSTGNDTTTIEKSNLIDSLISQKEETKSKPAAFTKIIRHNTIMADTTKTYCSLNPTIKLTSTPTIIIDTKKQFQSSNNVNKKGDSLLSYLFHDFWKTLLEVLLIAGLIVALVGLVYILFSPTILFWMMLLSIALLGGLVALLIKSKRSNSNNIKRTIDMDDVKDTMAHIGTLAVEFAVALVLTR